MPNRRVRSFLQMLESLGEIAWYRNLDTDEMHFTPALWDLLGYTLDEAPKDRIAFSMLFHPADVARVQRESERFISGESAVLNVEFRLRAKPKAWRWFQIRGREIVRKPNGDPYIAAGVLLDVDEARRNQVHALEDHERLKLAKEGSGAGLWELDLRKRLLKMDARSLEMHGFPPDLPMPMDVDEWVNWIDPDHRFQAASSFRKAVADDAVYNVEYSVNSGEIWINGIGKAILNEEGEPVRMIGLNLDITEAKKAQHMIEEMRDELLHASRISAMGAMAATLAHELNQPLTAIANYSAGAQRIAGTAETPMLGNAMKAIEDNAQRAGEIIRRMRHMARGGAIRKEAVKFDRLVKDAIRYARTGCEGVTFDLRLHDGAAMLADAIQIQQVLINLIRNACQAMESNPTDERVLTITTGDLAQAVQVSVEDRGPGIPEKLLATIFEANFTTKAEGMGIGLSISRTIVEAHGGKLWAENTGEGARFCFTLPVLGD